MAMLRSMWVVGAEEEDDELDHLAYDRRCGSDRLCHRSRGKKNIGCSSSDNGVRIQRVFVNEREHLQSSPKEEHHSDSADDSISDELLHNVKMKEKKTTSFGRTIVLNLGDRDIDDDDPLEYVDGEASAEDEDVDQQDLNLASQKIRGQTMTDLFQDAFTASALEEPMVQAAKFSG
ncbi:hypothetical protein ACMD2_05144 [Ananas comosus]|uniref:Uncharacterized protein n=1 Tax=Ananas comosus TaxID=4615 RepID=A0A199UKV2_ANACO|nr:hypothetical protein ACMD2_05144 [Ananas comosus]